MQRARNTLVAAAMCIAACSTDAPSPTEPVDPDQSTVTVDRTTGAIADGLDAVTLTITLRSGAGLALSAREVSVMAPADVLVAPVPPTDAQGITKTTLTSVVAGSKSVAISVDDSTLHMVVIEFAAGPAAGLVFLDQPSDGELGSHLPLFRAAFVDAFDNVVTTETGTISLSMKSNSAFAGLYGGTTQPAIDGIATFATVGVTAIASGLIMQARSASTPARDSEPFDVVIGEPSSTTSTLVVSPSTALADGLSPVSVDFTLRNGGNIPIPGYAVSLAATGSGNSFYPTIGVTDAQGRVTVTWTSTTAGTPTLTVTAGTLVLTATASFVEPPCTPMLPGLPSTIVGPPVWTTRVADFDNDGHRDVAVLHRTSEQDLVSILRGVGNGRFHAAVQYPVGEDSGSLAYADFDQDGDLDIVVDGRHSQQLRLLVNQGAGQFIAGTPVGVPYPALDLQTVDFNTDGKADIVARSDYVVMTIAGNGDGSFQTPTSHVLDVPMYSASTATIEVARLDGNATYDIFTIANGYYNVLLGDPNGTFQVLTSVYGIGESTDSIAIADYDEDAVLDMVIGLTLLRGNGNGTFASPTNLAEPFSYGRASTHGDLDGDNHDDLVVSITKPGVGGVRILRGSGSATFAPPQDVALGRGARAVAVDDFDEDGKDDVLVLQDGIRSSISVLRGTGMGTVIGGARFFGDSVGSGRAFFWPVTADFDGNGTLDFVAANDVSEQTGIQLAAMDGTLTATPTYYVASIADVAVGDFDVDGNTDLLTLGTGLSWLRGNGDGTLEAPVVSTMPSGWAVSLRIVDLDAGTTDDVAFVNPIQSKVTVAFGSGAGAWTDAVQYSVPTEPVALEVADLDSDGDRDLVVASRNGNAVSVLTNDGAGVFTPGTPLASAGRPAAIAIGDIDGDLIADIVVGDQERNTIGFFKGNGTGGFSSEVRIDIGVISPRIVLRDLDGDLDLDLLVSASGLYLFRGGAGATFLPPLLYDTGFLQGPLLADFDDDGKVDIMASQGGFQEPGFTIAYNKGCQ